jgi:hypothetical protein
MSKFGSWLAGIIGSIIVGVAIYYFTKATPPPPTPPPPAVTVFEGMVYSGSAPVPRAMVAVELRGSGITNGPVHDITDANGAYRFDFTGLPTDAGATLNVTATGYRDSASQSLSSPLQPDVHLDFPLSPVAVPPPAGLGVGPGAHPLQPGNLHIPKYVRKGATEAVQIKIPPKA